MNDAVCTVADAAAWFRVSEKTIRTWVSRYRLDRQPGPGRSHYRFLDLVAADRRARGLGPRP